MHLYKVHLAHDKQNSIKKRTTSCQNIQRTSSPYTGNESSTVVGTPPRHAGHEVRRTGTFALPELQFYNLEQHHQTPRSGGGGGYRSPSRPRPHSSLWSTSSLGSAISTNTKPPMNSVAFAMTSTAPFDPPMRTNSCCSVSLSSSYLKKLRPAVSGSTCQAAQVGHHAAQATLGEVEQVDGGHAPARSAASRRLPSISSRPSRPRLRKP